MSAVHPVAILRALFCTVCSVCRLVLEMMGDHMALAYSRMGLMMALYVVVSVSFCLPQLVPESALRMLVVLSALALFCLVCSVKVSLGSSTSPNVLGF